MPPASGRSSGPLVLPEDRLYMRRAVRLAMRGWGRVSPNPMVGAVVVRDGAVIGQGWHQEYGGPHAEIHALGQAGARAAGATLYVSLEPCAHHGKTPPCTDAIVAAGIRRVVYGAPDPDPTAGGGATVLSAAGLAVEGGVLAAASRRLNAAFHYAHERQEPWVALKLAQSLDGAIAPRPGVRMQLTGQRAQDAVHRLRAGFDAILVGRGTVVADDPLLTARGTIRPRQPPARVVFDTRAVLSPASRLVATAAEAPVHLVHADADPSRIGALRERGVHTHAVAGARQGVAVEAALRALWSAGLRSILCEGGARLAATLIALDRVERIYLLVAPLVLGPESFQGLTAPLRGSWRMSRAHALGRDALLVLDRTRAERQTREGERSVHGNR